MSGDDNIRFEDLLTELDDSVNKLTQDKITPYREAIAPIPSQRLADQQRIIDDLISESDEQDNLTSGDELRYLRSGHSPRLIKKLRRGEYNIQDHLDLHSMIASEAKQETHHFINECALDKVRAVRIVHGKGLNSHDNKPVIKNLLLGWLSKNDHVIAVVSARDNDGGTGAVYVLLDK